MRVIRIMIFKARRKIIALNNYLKTPKGKEIYLNKRDYPELKIIRR